MVRAWLSLGANLDDPDAQIARALAKIDALPDTRITARSALITTAPWGKTDQPDFRNMAVAIKTELSPFDLLDACIGIETSLGRVRGEKWGPRHIDIDIIAVEKFEMTSSRLTLPHPNAHQRDFVLNPLREFAPEVAAWIKGRKR